MPSSVLEPQPGEKNMSRPMRINLPVGMVTNDDIFFSDKILKKGPTGFLSALWDGTLQYGRPHIFKMFSYFLPFIIGSFWYFKLVSMVGLILSLLLFARFVDRILGQSLGFTLLLSLLFLQNSWDQNPLVAFTGQITFLMSFLVASWLCFLKYLEAKRRPRYVISERTCRDSPILRETPDLGS
jgi:hypothetical protein